MLHILAIVCALAAGAYPGEPGDTQMEMLPPGALADRAAPDWETTVPTSPFVPEPGAVRPVGSLAAGLYRLWKPLSPLGRAYGPGEFPYRSWYKHPYLVYRGNYFTGRYDYHRLFNYAWHAPVSVPGGVLPAAERAIPGLFPQGTIILPPGSTLRAAPLGLGPNVVSGHPDAVVPE